MYCRHHVQEAILFQSRDTDMVEVQQSAKLHFTLFSRGLIMQTALQHSFFPQSQKTFDTKIIFITFPHEQFELV